MLPANNTIRPPLIAHVIHRLDVGGLENGLVNLINNMPDNKYRHIIICMTEYTDFRYRIKKDDVKFYQLNKRDGKDIFLLYRMWRLLRKIKPDIVHTRNIGTLECTFPAFLAGVRFRVHGEHGRDMADIDGTNKKYIFLRKIFRPFICKYIALSRDLENWLKESIEIPENKIVQLYNGVDIDKFSPKEKKRQIIPTKFLQGNKVKVIGTVGRISAEKDQFSLVNALHVLFEKNPDAKNTLILVIVGDGPLFSELEELVKRKELQSHVWLSGSRDDIAGLLSEMDIFVLPSLGEGISNTILEAMASGLPVVATNVGGNPELVEEGVTGLLIPPANPVVMASALQNYIDEPEKIKIHGLAGRRRVEEKFSMQVMVNSYLHMYDDVMAN